MTAPIGFRTVHPPAHGSTVRPPVVPALPEIEDAQTFGERMHVRIRNRRGEAARKWLRDALVQAGLGQVNVRQVAPSLEDVFIDRIRRASAAAPAASSDAGRPS